MSGNLGRRREDESPHPLQLRAKAGAGTSTWRGWGGQETGLGDNCLFPVRRQKYLKKERVCLTQRSEKVVGHRLSKLVKR